VGRAEHAAFHAAHLRIVKKAENHCHIVAIYFMYCNFCRAYYSLRSTSAIRADTSNRVWNVEDLVGLSEEPSAKTA